MRRSESRKAGLEVERLGPGVEHPRPDLDAVGPVGNEAPAVGGDGPAILALDDDERLVGRSDVEPGPRVVDEWLRREDLGELGRRALLGESAAHGGQV